MYNSSSFTLWVTKCARDNNNNNNYNNKRQSPETGREAKSQLAYDKNSRVKNSSSRS